ncbi:acyl-CoA dehydrogenase family protein [Achromobacter denitrificans]|uniref:Acyl-CoA dehydrogenase family protein n=2 Tax=Achromobacter denitrificans TaxID=32002 RepID=A0A6N0JDM2_ACHDE|nr:MULTISPECIES: acyl-CoA dehydrogenase family protein [Achromobacter]MBV2159508.1 acyl-CoA dehydrogenase family protein [Achromobacter denitrificans]MDX3877006.1 acyl-CoA dehydrogenase family protein [Achromobacter sp.]QKQ45211.1 acyl-CoA dehydrogenase family protein [Achromobacter denitrificans]WFC68869.1 acyl-CoA dehydrogenase family protein [Achromobacter denitrificans]
MHPKQERHDDDRVQDLCERVRRFVDEVAIPAESPAIARDVAALDRSVARLRVQARDAGLYAPQLPEQWGGLGLDWRGLARVLEEAGRGFLGPAALNCAAPDQPNMLTLLRLGSPAQQARYLAPLVRGEQRACFAMTEPAPGAGSDPSMLRTRAARRGKRWVLDGHKQFISGGVGADFALVLARAEEGVTLFLVPADTPGYRVVRDIGMVTGYQIGGHAEILLDGCEVGDDAVLGEPGRGLEYAQLRLEPARLSHCMRYIGRARRALETAQAYVARRDSFGARLADLQQIQAMVADSHIDLHASRLMTLDCAGRMDAGLSVKQHSAMAKVFVSEAVNRVADRAVQMMGASGLSDDTPVAMVWQEMRPFRIYDGANELHRATLARRLLAQP